MLLTSAMSLDSALLFTGLFLGLLFGFACAVVALNEFLQRRFGKDGV
jgi:hypothetical protein